MGIAKRQWMEDMERGWSYDADRFVCAKCVEDSFLRSKIRKNVESHECTFCKRKRSIPCAAPLGVLVELVANAAKSRYGTPDSVALPYVDGEYIDELVGVDEMLMNIGFDATSEVFRAVADSFSEWDWVHASNGSWGQLTPDQEMSFAWTSFCHEVRHRTRFYFHRSLYDDVHDGISPAEMMEAIGDLVLRIGLARTLDVGVEFYRGRIRRVSDSWEPDRETLGAPPQEIARSGRMNPTGIPYLYVAEDINTMNAEIGELGENEVIEAAVFRTVKPLVVVDFTQLPPMPSFFDLSKRQKYEDMAFLRQFVREISKPVERRRLEDIHYAPTQVMCEYFAQAFQPKRLGQVGGIIYPSAANPGGRNLAVFPDRRYGHGNFEALEMSQVLRWKDVMQRVTAAATS